MAVIKIPSARQIVLAAELVLLREEAGKTPKEVYEALGISAPTFSRIENAGSTIKPGTVKDILDFYGVPSDQRELLIQLARDAPRHGWWQAYRDLFKAGFPALEDEASAHFVWEPDLVAGLVQTPDYHRALIRSMKQMALNPEGVERRVRARRARQALVTRDNPPDLHIVLGEAAIRQMVGGPSVMREQASVLWEASHRANVTLQIVPFAAGAHAGLDGPFTLFDFPPMLPHRAAQQIAATEGPGGIIYLESAAALSGINVRRESIVDAAMSPSESAALLKGAADSTV